MKGITRHIPNTLTCVSLAFGFYASILGLSGNYFGAMIAIFIAAVFDFLDGFAARLLKAYSPMGKELDSISDMVSFGVAPGMMLFSFVDELLHSLSWNESWACKLLLLSAFAITVLSGLRLAKFNIDTRQTKSFLGLPVPAHAIFWSALIVAISSATAISADSSLSLGVSSLGNDASTSCHIFCGLIPLSDFIATIPAQVLIIALSVIAIATSLLLVSEIPMFSLKVSSFRWKEAKMQYILILSAIILIIFFGSLGISATILLYIILSLLGTQKS